MGAFKSVNIPQKFHNYQLQKIREQNHFQGNLADVQQELRERRKSFLGSHLSLRMLVRSEGTINEPVAYELSSYLAHHTIPFWKANHDKAEEFCLRFYRIVIYCITYDNVAQECADDIIQLADCLVRSKDIFQYVAKQMLPPDMVGELFDFIESYDEEFYNASFVDAVLGAVCVLLGVLPEPQQTPADDNWTRDKK